MIKNQIINRETTMIASVLSLLVVVVAIYVWTFKGQHFQLLPHESDLDTSSWWISKISHVIAERPFPTNTSFGIAAGRFSYNLLTRFSDQISLLKEPDLNSIQYQELSVAVPGRYDTAQHRLMLNNQIQIRIYNNEGKWRIDGSRKPVMIWYHGGGCVVGSMDQDHVLSLQLAKESDFIIVNVDYRLAPEHIFPTGVEDSYSAFDWVVHNIERYGGDARRIILGGESAGGYMAAAVTSKYLVEHPSASRRSSPIIGLYLVYPSLAPFADLNDPDVERYADTNGLLPLVTIENFRNLYAGTKDLAVRDNYLFSPLLTPVDALERYPSTVFVIAKYDVLAKESVVLAERLNALKIRTKVITYKSTIHAFFGKTIVSPVGRTAVTESIQALLALVFQ
jgi:acetyl esterase